VADATFLGLAGANLAATVLDSFTTGSPAVNSSTLNSALQTQLSPALAHAAVLASQFTKINVLPADIAAARNLPVQAFVKQSKNPTGGEQSFHKSTCRARLLRFPSPCASHVRTGGVERGMWGELSRQTEVLQTSF
jgi:hypothetical protein